MANLENGTRGFSTSSTVGDFVVVKDVISFILNASFSSLVVYTFSASFFQLCTSNDRDSVSRELAGHFAVCVSFWVVFLEFSSFYVIFTVLFVCLLATVCVSFLFVLFSFPSTLETIGMFFLVAIVCVSFGLCCFYFLQLMDFFAYFLLMVLMLPSFPST